jgi:hypothetical protein
MPTVTPRLIRGTITQPVEGSWGQMMRRAAIGRQGVSIYGKWSLSFGEKVTGD